MSNVHFTAGDILAQLDECATNFSFPMLDNGYIYPVTSRLSVFGDKERWVITVESVGYFQRLQGHEAMETSVYVFGNSIGFEPGMANGNTLWLTEDSDDGPAFLNDQFGTLNPEVDTMLIRDKKVTIPKDPAFYVARNVELADAPAVRVYEFMRACLPEHRAALLATEDELYDTFRQNLPKLLQLDEWFHPDVADEQKPSENETFQQIAAVLESGDVSLYKPTMEPNNHWRNWPVGGSL
jgi:hypothetical protein